MQLSGVGPGDLLQQYGIPVVQDTPGVGANLQDHLQLRCAYRVQGAKTLNTLSANLWGKAKIALEYALRRTGPMSMAPSQLGAFARSGPEMATPDLEYHVQPLSLEAFGQDLDPFDALTASVCNLRPESRGHVRIMSPDPAAHPQIQPNYLSAPRDRQVAAKAIRLTRQIMDQPAMMAHRPEEFRPGPGYETDAELAEAAGAHGMVGGQAMDLEAVGRQLDLAQIEAMHIRKTGALLLACVRLPCIAAGADGALREALDAFGKRIGLAFQIQDDVLDETATAEQIGKTAGKDRRHGKPTWVSVAGLAEARQRAGELFAEARAALDRIGPRAAPLRWVADLLEHRRS